MSSEKFRECFSGFIVSKQAVSDFDGRAGVASTSPRSGAG